MKEIFKRTFSVLLAGSIAVQPVVIQADTADDIAYMEQQQAETYEDTYEVEGAINALEEQKQALFKEIDEYDQKLVKTIATIKLLDEQLLKNEEALKKTKADLEIAEQNADAQYKAMKERIKFLYEAGGDIGWAGLLLTDSMTLSDVVDKASYTQELYRYDRKELDAYLESTRQVEELQKRQLEQRAELENTKREQEETKKYLESLIEEARRESVDIENKLNEANALAETYANLIMEQNQAISALYAQQDEEIRAAEEEAYRLAMERQAYEQQNAYYDTVYQDTYVQPEATYISEPVQTYQEPVYSEPVYEEPAYTEPAVTEQTYDNTAYTAPVQQEQTQPAAQTTSTAASSKGQEVINHALQYVGNPYVWGGTDPVNGADCSGFVQAVYREMGYNISRTSYTQLNDGISVSYADAQPGDIIDYGSHVALYMGDGQIVHAANEELGITTSSNATYQPIVDVRRIITE